MKAVKIMIAALLLVIVGTAFAYADTTKESFTEADFTFDIYIDDGVVGSLYVTGYTGTKTEIVLPTSVVYQGTPYPVEEIGLDAFKGSNATKITVPDGYMYIAPGAFSECPNLASISIGNTVEYWGEHIFNGCPNLKTYHIGEPENPQSQAIGNDLGIGKDLEGNIYEGVSVTVRENSNMHRYLVDENDKSRAAGGNVINIITGGSGSGKGKDGTPYGEGASQAVVHKALINLASEKDPKGAIFYKLKVRASKIGKRFITLRWNKQAKAAKYLIYGSKCGKTLKLKKLFTVTGTTKKVTKVKGVKVKAKTYYKFIVVALDKNSKVVTTSTFTHFATKGKYRNATKVTVKKTKVTLRSGKTFALKGKAIVKKPNKKHCAAVRYFSTNKKIATVSAKGVIKGVKKGSCKVYAYSQNGKYKMVSVTVK